MIFRHLLNMRSHPTWVRGLKPKSFCVHLYKKQSHPTWVRGLKLIPFGNLKTQTGRTLRGCVD